MGKREMKEAPAKRRVPVGAGLLIAAAVALMMIGGVVAWLSASTAPVKNTFTADAAVNPTISEEFDETIKKNVKVNVGNTGYAVYVRAAVVVTWKDAENGNVLGTVPVENTDYTIRYNTTDWFYEGGFWYYRLPVNTGGTTRNLIDECVPVNVQTPVGYGLNVEIIAQTIQALGTTDDGNIPAVEDAWKVVTIGTNKELVKKS